MDQVIQKIKELQFENKYSTKMLAERLRVTAQTLYDYFSGKTQISIRNLKAIANVFEVPMSVFFEEKKEVSKTTQFLKGLIGSEYDEDDYKECGRNELISENRVLNTERMFFKEMNVRLLENITEVYVKAVEKDSNLKDFLSELQETKRLIAQINTLSNLKENVFINNRFFYLFTRSHLNPGKE